MRDTTRYNGPDSAPVFNGFISWPDIHSWHRFPLAKYTDFATLYKRHFSGIRTWSDEALQEAKNLAHRHAFAGNIPLSIQPTC